MKKFLAMAAVVTLAFSARAASVNYLYWQIQDSDVAFQYATIVAIDNATGAETELTMVDTEGNGVGTAVLGDGVDASEPDTYVTSSLATYARIEDAADYSYRIDLYDFNGTMLGTSDTQTYSEIAQFLYSDMGTAAGTAWAPSFSEVPEPTGAALAFFGAALLAVVRRRRPAKTASI